MSYSVFFPTTVLVTDDLSTVPMQTQSEADLIIVDGEIRKSRYSRVQTK